MFKFVLDCSKRLLVIGIGALFLSCHSAWALEPHEILVLANKNAARSVGLAKYYINRSKDFELSKRSIQYQVSSAKA